jgi:hypothetical protein
MHANILTFALLSTLAAAQIPGLPTCATGCVGTSFGSCGNLDVKCICSNTELLSGLACCVSTACDAADQESELPILELTVKNETTTNKTCLAETIQFANSLCAGQGVNNLPQSATCAAGAASSTSAASGSSSSDSSASATSSASGDSTSSASSAASESTASGSSSESSSGTASSSAASQTGSSSSSSAVAQSTGGAESLKSGFAGAGLGMVLAGVVAAL